MHGIVKERFMDGDCHGCSSRLEEVSYPYLFSALPLRGQMDANVAIDPLEATFHVT